ncbi:MAG TPA: hypothetical protein VFN26_10260 [Candidatus Acidoferrum sp.]|nr:hypothetical protein [Candidatus Acidoferrum sp.]
MSLFLLSIFFLVALLLGVFLLSSRHSWRLSRLPGDPVAFEECELHHATHLPQIRQALSETDNEFLTKRGSSVLRRRVHRERRGVVLGYLRELRRDFEKQLQIARIIAALSPEVTAVQEWERLRLTLKFIWQYEIIRMQLQAGLAPLPRLSGLANIVSGLSVRMENAIKELGERAAMATELASALDRGGVDHI